MKIFLSLVAIVVTSSFAVDVERTVLQVENILKENSQLPRLSREEILQLLNDIRAEDARSSSSRESREHSRKQNIVQSSTNKREHETYKNTLHEKLKFSVKKVPNIEENVVDFDQDTISTTEPTYTKLRDSTKKPEPTLMVVLPYTPRDGSSLQELYTRPPRVEVVPVSKVTLESNINALNENRKKYISENIHETLKINEHMAKKAQMQDIPEELKTFLNLHGLKTKPGQDHFLLPLEGFKPLPPPKSLDSSVELPENILLTYDLVAPDSSNISKIEGVPPSNVIFEPLRPEPSIELDGSASEAEKTVLPLDLPKSRKTKAVSDPLNYEPIDYDAVKVIPLKQGPIPIDNEEITKLETEFNKRQAENDTLNVTTDVNNITTTSTEVASKLAATDAAAATDVGASITDLEDSFGGAAPAPPGDSELPPPKKNGFYWMLDWNSFLEVGDGDTKVNIRFEPKLGDPQMFLPVNVP